DLEAYLALPPEDDRASLTYPAVWDYENPTEIPTDAVYEISPDGKYAASTCNGENNYDADGYYYPFYTAVIIRLDDKVITDVYDFGAEVNIEKFVWSPDSDGAFILCLGHKDNDSFVLLSAGEIKGGLVETQPLKEYANRLSAQEDFADKLTLRIAPIEWTKGEDGGYWEILCEFNFADDNGIPVSGGQFVLDARSHKPV
ncbi:MAG: hypothetical protein LBI36_03715, partial [Oscillospiraceae bacterium]|nr:hypothetical protein [Oscillospiraceae bacterium]